MALEFELNGKVVTLGEVDPHQTLLHFLRARGLTGTKEGCAEGECGACAVAWLRRNDRVGGGDQEGTNSGASSAAYVAVNSCLMPLAEVAGSAVFTVEHLAQEGELHPVQRAMVERGGSQCGYCTPGFVMSLFCEYYRANRTSYDPEAIGGNLCRCTGYRPIVEVAQNLDAPAATDAFLVQLRKRPQRDVRPPNGPRFYQPESLSSVLELLRDVPGAVLLGGGTDLMVNANQRGVQYPALISLTRVPELATLNATPTEVTIGAGVTLATLERWVHDNAPDLVALAQLLPLFSSRLIRNRATLGGNLGTASPIGDAPPVLLALDATLELVSATGKRRVEASQFFEAYRETQLGKAELICSVHIPRPAPSFQRFHKLSKRALDDISTVAAAFALALDANGCVTHLRAAYGGVAATPVRAYALEQAAHGKPWHENTLQQLTPLLTTLGTPMSDHRGSAEYRRAMIPKLFEQFFYESQAAKAAAE